ncbi:hypothetical protein [Hyalangium minutum]|uniref:MxcI n=1 Tax=Hyalangium minutum TaxID=394096 RepID=A0A085WFW7_9BACT|nr:hypothetical protein [Hyalangium minutum]KFE66580.1 MxcI [Hyalangium minutum]
MKFVAHLRTLCLAVTALALPLLAACGEDKQEPDDNTPTDTPLYAITTQIVTTDTPQSYIVLTDTLDVSGELKLENAIELPGRALGVGIPKSRSLFVGGSENATVTRYNLTSDGRLEKGATVSFEGKGVASIGEYHNQFQFISETKAYYFDGRTAQVIIWNPTDMSVTGSIALPDVTVSGALLSFATHPIRRGDQVIVPMGWRPTTGIGITKQAGVVVVDSKTDTAKVVTDTRCGYVRDGVLGADGKVYLATEVYGAAVYRVAGGDTPVPCLLRFDPQSLTFDGTFYQELSALTKGGTVGSLLPGPNNTAYLRVFDESLFQVQQGTHPRVLASASAWKWWQLRLDTLAATPVDKLPATTGSTFIFPAGDRTIFTEFTNGSASTNLRELTDQSGKVDASLSGISFSFLQVR